MQLDKSRRFLAVALVAAAFVTVSTEAAGRRRAVTPPTAGQKVESDEISGTVVDDVTGQPIAAIRVSAGNKSDTTETDGKFKLKNVTSYQGKFGLEASRTGYTTQRVEITEPSTTLVIRVRPTPTVTLRKTNGANLQIDYESVVFGYPIPFSGYVSGPSDDFCRPNGSAVTIDRSQVRRFVGPATLVTQASCCQSHQVLKVNVELKTGETTDVFFADSCSGIASIDFIGRNHVTGVMEYTPFKDITEIVFP